MEQYIDKSISYECEGSPFISLLKIQVFIIRREVDYSRILHFVIEIEIEYC
ncbi:hypothetical protein HanRHA438_MTg0865981 (mitochondrion) [Helianthus annuus]|nr:hypothetical protein HanRHA438_MTg0865981 [Helianthus annuus]